MAAPEQHRWRPRPAHRLRSRHRFAPARLWRERLGRTRAAPPPCAGPECARVNAGGDASRMPVGRRWRVAHLPDVHCERAAAGWHVRWSAKSPRPYRRAFVKEAAQARSRLLRRPAASCGGVHGCSRARAPRPATAPASRTRLANRVAKRPLPTPAAFVAERSPQSAPAAAARRSYRSARFRPAPCPARGRGEGRDRRAPRSRRLPCSAHLYGAAMRRRRDDSGAHANAAACLLSRRCRKSACRHPACSCPAVRSTGHSDAPAPATAARAIRFSRRVGSAARQQRAASGSGATPTRPQCEPRAGTCPSMLHHRTWPHR